MITYNYNDAYRERGLYAYVMSIHHNSCTPGGGQPKSFYPKSALTCPVMCAGGDSPRDYNLDINVSNCMLCNCDIYY